jgi:hypothetical protein
MQSRFDAIMASMPQETVNQARAREIGFLLSNPAFDEQLARRTAKETVAN